MNTSTLTRHPGRVVAAIITLIAFLVLAGVGIYGLVSGPKLPATTPQSEPPAVVPSVPVGPSPHVPKPSTVKTSTDPDVFARNVATALFTWDTASTLMPLDYSAAILAVGDPTGTEQAGLASDVGNFLPSREQWVELRKYSTAQTLTISSTFVPDSWGEAVAQAAPGQIPPGATAITVQGTRHRTGIWEGQPVAEDFDVALTIFLACPQKADSCHVLRLSQPGNPLQ
ncbi:hypothetical protein U6G28_06520 [Actinomycetaceae bacterium MB13-C1-2]|nr:hypothetical protein U6G28_06520 [Actinomycetaceae bacterium MB13-C1-2]